MPFRYIPFQLQPTKQKMQPTEQKVHRSRTFHHIPLELCLHYRRDSYLSMPDTQPTASSSQGK